MRHLGDRVAVVTGAASGIGRAVAILLARKGCHLALVDRNEEGLRETARSVEAAGRKASIHLVDVADTDQMSALPGQVLAEHGAVHVLVNNAGVALDATFEESSLEDLEWILGINLWGVILGCKLFLPHLRQVDEAHIVNVSSLFGLVGVPRNSAYCTTKFAVRGLSESLWAELSAEGIGVTSVHPGGIKTNIVRAARHAPGREKQEAIELFDRAARITPERAAEKIVRGIERGAQRVRIGPETYLGDWLKRLFPNGVQRLLRAAAARAERQRAAGG